MEGRTESEKQGISLLGNQGTKYPQDYAPEVLETFVNKHQEMIILSNSTVRNLPVCVRLPDSRILRP